MNIHFIVLQSKNISIMTSEKEKRKNTLFTADENDKITDSRVELNSCIEITGRWFQIVTNMERSVSYL